MVDPLGSWRDGEVKSEILGFLSASADPSSESFIPVAGRIATFDNDGTLWAEQPAPVQTEFLLGKLAQQAAGDPRLADEEPYRSILQRDPVFFAAVARQDPDAILSFLAGVGAAWEGATPAEYEAEALAYLTGHVNPRFGRPDRELVYRPMLELVELLRSYEWRVYICSGGGRDFMRAICEETWGIPKEHVIGSAPEWAYRDGALVRENALRGNLALGPGKPEHIFARTGRLPRFAAGNGDVDIEMLEVADFALVLVHDDDKREVSYATGAEHLLGVAADRGWTTASIKEDWITVF